MKFFRFFVLFFFAVLTVVPVHAAEEKLARPSFAEPRLNFAEAKLGRAEQKLGVDLFRFDDVVEISAPITGDLYAMGREVIVHGPVTGDVLAVGQTVTVEGAVAGNVRIIGDTVRLVGNVSGNVSVAASSLQLGDGVRVEKNITFVGQSFDLAGTAHGDVRLWMFAPEEAHMRSHAVVDGVVTVYASAQPVVDDGALLRHAVERTVPLDAVPAVSDILFSRISAFFSLFLVGLVAIHVMHRPSLVIASIMNDKPLEQILWGLGCIVIAPLLVIILAFTVIGIPLAVMLLATWGALLYGARAFACLALGFLFLERLDRKRRVHSLVLVLLIGTLLLMIGESIPFIGMIIALGAACWGVGGIITLLRTISLGKFKP